MKHTQLVFVSILKNMLNYINLPLWLSNLLYEYCVWVYKYDHPHWPPLVKSSTYTTNSNICHLAIIVEVGIVSPSYLKGYLYFEIAMFLRFFCLCGCRFYAKHVEIYYRGYE